MGQNKFYTDLDSLLMPVHGAWCMVHARCRARRCEEGAIQLSTHLCSHTPWLLYDTNPLLYLRSEHLYRASGEDDAIRQSRFAQILVRFNASLTEDESPVVCEHALLPFSRPIKEGV